MLLSAARADHHMGIDDVRCPARCQQLADIRRIHCVKVRDISRRLAVAEHAGDVGEAAVVQLSASSVLRILAEHPVKPWQYQSWISPRDPDFAARASVILDLYQGFHQGKRLRPGDRILSVDAKPSIQARGRCRPTAPAARGKPVRVEGAWSRRGQGMTVPRGYQCILPISPAG